MNHQKTHKKTSDGLAILDAITGNDPEVQAQIEEEMIHLRIAYNIRKLRIGAGLSQAELAKRIGTNQSVISQLEDAEYERHSLSMLRRIAAALGRQVEIRFVARGKKLQYA